MKKILKTIIKRIKTISPMEAFVIIGIAAIMMVTIKYFSINKQWRTIRVEVVGKNWSDSYNQYGYKTPFWMSEKIKNGQTEKDAGGKIIAQITNIDNYTRGREEAEVYLTVKVLTFYSRRTEKYIFKNKNLELGAPIQLELDNILVLGQIIDNEFPQNGYPRKEVVVVSTWETKEQWQIDQVRAGDKMFNRANGEAIAEILGVITEPTTSSIFLFTSGNRVEIIQDPKKLDAIITAKITVNLRDGRWYFGQHQEIKVGNPLYVYTDKTSIQNMLIKEIQDVDDNLK